jgi:hypothetical protein
MMNDDFEFFQNKNPDKIYVSKRLNSFSDPSRKVRMISQVSDLGELHAFAEIRDELLIRITPHQRQEVVAVLYEDTRQIEHLTIQRFETKSGKPHQKVSFTFSQDEIERFIRFIKAVSSIDFNTTGKFSVNTADLDRYLVSQQAKERFLEENQELVHQFVQNNITEKDIIALAYRKKQLEIFKRLLTDKDFFTAKMSEGNKKQRKEDVWQSFFEDNPWIFGYGLSYIFSTPLDDRKLEQVTSGFDFSQSGKRVDALMKTRGAISSLCFVEIKTHETQLLEHKPYRAECWRASDELIGSVAQIQKTVHKAAINIRD